VAGTGRPWLNLTEIPFLIDSSQLQAASRTREEQWREYALGDRHLTEFVAEHSDAFDCLEYDLRDFFSEAALNVILSHGVKTIDANRRGLRMVSFGSGGIREGDLADGARLSLAFRRWAAKGWIYFTLAAGDGASEAKVIGA
jgi:hypothetical protein